jgi:hypothetical protein
MVLEFVGAGGVFIFLYLTSGVFVIVFIPVWFGGCPDPWPMVVLVALNLGSL